MQSVRPTGERPVLVYRPDIDGLRAIAVLVVVAYHAFPGRVPGGFSGVDVFFVISGYLIAGDMARRIDARTFTLASFFARRVRRLFPALLTVLAACLGVGTLVLLPDELQSLLGHIAASAGFVENFRLLSESGYFDTSSTTKPLLHIWSLAIEEQFYLLSPFLLILIRGPRARFASIAVLTLASFAANVLTVANQPDAAYFLPHTRFWELFIGVLIALAPSAGVGPAIWRRREAASAYAEPPPASAAGGAWFESGIAWLGAFLIGAAVLVIDRDQPYPDGLALLPTIGTALLIVAGPSSWLGRRLLGGSAIRTVGLMSYPLYLWHWPMLAFLRIVEGPNAPAEAKGAVLAASFLLALLTWRFIERPARRLVSQRRTTGLVTGMAALGSAAAVAASPAFSPPLPAGISPQQAALLRDLNFNLHVPRLAACDDSVQKSARAPTHCLRTRVDGTPTVALLGDSHAYALFVGIDQIDSRHPWVLIANSSCPPLLGVHVRHRGQDCLPRTQAAIETVAAAPAIRTVVLAFFGSYADAAVAAADADGTRALREPVVLGDDRNPGSSPRDTFATGLAATGARLRQAGKRVIVLVDVPELPFAPRDCIDRPLRPRRLLACELERSDVVKRQANLRAILQDAENREPQLALFDAVDVICDRQRCPVVRDGVLVYWDRHHLTARGSVLLAKPLVSWLGDFEGQ